MRLRVLGSISVSGAIFAASLTVVAAANEQNKSMISGPFKAVGLIGCEHRANSELTSEVTDDGTSLRTLSFRAISGFHALPTARVGGGKTVGTISIATWGSERLRYRLATPKHAATGSVRLLSSGKLRVVYRPERRAFLSVYGLPPNTQYVFIGTRRNTLLRRTSDRTVLTTTGYLTGRPSETVRGDDKCALER